MLDVEDAERQAAALKNRMRDVLGHNAVDRVLRASDKTDDSNAVSDSDFELEP